MLVQSQPSYQLDHPAICRRNNRYGCFWLKAEVTHICTILQAGGLGFAPRRRGSEPRILLLDDPPICWFLEDQQTSTQVHKQGRMDSNHHPRIPSPVRCRGIARGQVTTACGMRTGRLLQPFCGVTPQPYYFGLRRSCQGGSRTPIVTLTGCHATIAPPGSKERATMLDLWFITHRNSPLRFMVIQSGD